LGIVPKPTFASLALSFILAVVAMPRVSAQQQPPRAGPANAGSITGTVTHASSGDPIEGVTVRVVGTSLGASTNAQGRYTITGVSPGIYAVETLRIGFAPSRKDDVRISAGARRRSPSRCRIGRSRSMPL
jgi:hypothetical protein